jgi:8-hydroxy-5-deazaflavin:NADPH oxidoreductase
MVRRLAAAVMPRRHERLSSRGHGVSLPGMKISTVGKGNIGGGLGDLWTKAGHELTAIGRSGGDVSSADAVLIAVPGAAVDEALGGIQGLEGKTVIDATNLIGVEPPDGFASNAEFIKSRTRGPTAKSFNLNFAALFDRLGSTNERPGNLWCGDEDARGVVEQLTRDAGYDPVYAGGLENAALQEQFLKLMFAINRGGLGPFFYRMAPPDQF